MLTRRSRKEAGASPKEVGASPKEVAASPKEVAASSKETGTMKNRSKKSGTPRRSKSRSIDRKIRTRSRSANKKIKEVRVVLENYDHIKTSEKPKRETRSRKTGESISKLKNSPTPGSETITQRRSPSVNKTNDEINMITTTTSSRLAYDTLSDDECNLPESELKAKVSIILFGGSFCNLILAVLLPVLVILAKIALKAKKNLIPFPQEYLKFANYYDQDVFIWTAAIVVLQMFISLLPLAKTSEKLQFIRFSGIMNLIVGALIVAATYYYKFPISFILEIVTEKTVPHVVASIVYTLIISVVLYVKSSKHSEKTYEYYSLNFMQKFFIGTRAKPTLGPINIKLAIYRYSMLMTILFNSLVIMDCLNKPVNIHLYVVAGLQIFNAIDKLLFECHLFPSYYLQKEKDGYWTIIQYFLQPAINFLPIQILLSKNLPANYILLSISTIIFIFGYGIQRYSDFIKYDYRTNSKYMRRCSGLTSRPMHGTWLFVKYPNYLGTIILHLALTLPTIELNLNSLQSWPVLLYPCYYIFTLVYRCLLVTHVVLLHNGYNWSAVNWNLIPKIF